MSNSKLLSNVASNLANSSGKILAVANGKIIWQQNYAWETANIGLLLAQSAYDSANNVAPQVQPAFDQANTAYELANSAYNRANTTYIPFFKSDGSQENIGLVSGTYLPFYTYTGNSSNILLITG